MMNNVIKLTVAGVLAFMGCSDDKSAGAAIEPNAVAQNSSSSFAVNSSSDEMRSIEFKTEPTEVVSLAQGKISVYGEENGAEASCSAGKKLYTAKFSINENRAMQKILYLDNFGSDCDSILELFKRSCARGVSSIAPDAACNGTGRLKAFCYIDEIDALTMCVSPGCAAENSKIDFDAIIRGFIEESDSLCGDISVGSLVADSADNRLELPSDSVVGIDTSEKRSFIIKPNVDTMVVFKSERALMDSLAWAFRQKIDENGPYGLPRIVIDNAQYAWTTSKEDYFVEGSSSHNRCNVDLYSKESGLVRHLDIFTTVVFDGKSNLESTILYRDSVIVYLIFGKIGSSTPLVTDLFVSECFATEGSYADYLAHLSDKPRTVALGCAVKNFSGLSFESIVGQQRDLCKNEYLLFGGDK